MALTTTDNPFSPIEDLESWAEWDHTHGYYLDRYMARVHDAIAQANPRMDDNLVWRLTEEAIVNENIYGNIVYVNESPDASLENADELHYDEDGYLIYE